MLAVLSLLAEQQTQDQSAVPLWYYAVMYSPLLVMAYVLFVLPQKRQERERTALIAGLKKNDRVLTTGGLIGIVHAVKDKDDEVVLKLDEGSNVRLTFTKGSIVRVLGTDSSKDTKEGGGV